jgi:hypothetical protein
VFCDDQSLFAAFHRFEQQQQSARDAQESVSAPLSAPYPPNFFKKSPSIPPSSFGASQPFGGGAQAFGGFGAAFGGAPPPPTDFVADALAQAWSAAPQQQQQYVTGQSGKKYGLLSAQAQQLTDASTEAILPVASWPTLAARDPSAPGWSDQLPTLLRQLSSLAPLQLRREYVATTELAEWMTRAAEACPKLPAEQQAQALACMVALAIQAGQPSLILSAVRALLQAPEASLPGVTGVLHQLAEHQNQLDISVPFQTAAQFTHSQPLPSASPQAGAPSFASNDNLLESRVESRVSRVEKVRELRDSHDALKGDHYGLKANHYALKDDIDALKEDHKILQEEVLAVSYQLAQLKLASLMESLLRKSNFLQSIRTVASKPASAHGKDLLTWLDEDAKRLRSRQATRACTQHAARTHARESFERSRHSFDWLLCVSVLVTDILFESKRTFKIPPNVLFQQFLDDHPSWQKIFPDGKALLNTYKALNKPRTVIAHPPTPSVEEVEKLLSRFKISLEKDDLYKHAKAACDSLAMFQAQNPQAEDSDDDL